MHMESKKARIEDKPRKQVFVYPVNSFRKQIKQAAPQHLPLDKETREALMFDKHSSICGG